MVDCIELHMPQAYLLADEVDPNATTFTDDSKCDTAIVVGSDSMGLTLPASFVWNRQRDNTDKPSTDAVSKAKKDEEELNPLAVPLSSDVQVCISLPNVAVQTLTVLSGSQHFASSQILPLQ